MKKLQNAPTQKRSQIALALAIFITFYAHVAKLQKPDEDALQIAFVKASDIYLMNSDGSDQKQITAVEPGPTSHPSWSPDNRNIAFDAVVSNPTGSASFNTEIFTIDIATSQLVNLTNNKADDVFPVWSPQGDRIAFVSNREGNWDIYLMEINGKNLVNLTHDEATDGIHGLTWSPDGSQIAFVSDRDQGHNVNTGNDEVENIYVIDVPETMLSPEKTVAYNLTSEINECPAGAFYRNPSWSINNQMAFALTCSINWDIFMFDVDKVMPSHNGDFKYSNLTRRTNEDGALGLSWSPDGTKIIFVSNHPETTQATSEDIFIADVSKTLQTDTPQILQLTNDPSINNYYGFPVWEAKGSEGIS